MQILQPQLFGPPNARISRAAYAPLTDSLHVWAQGFLAEGLQRTTAGLGSVIIDSQPLTVALLATLLLGEPFSRSAAAGLAVGIIGLCLLELPPEAVFALPAKLTGVAQRASPCSQGRVHMRQASMLFTWFHCAHLPWSASPPPCVEQRLMLRLPVR